jgi:hypothetical protein
VGFPSFLCQILRTCPKNFICNFCGKFRGKLLTSTFQIQMRIVMNNWVLSCNLRTSLDFPQLDLDKRFNIITARFRRDLSCSCQQNLNSIFQQTSIRIYSSISSYSLVQPWATCGPWSSLMSFFNMLKNCCFFRKISKKFKTPSMWPLAQFRLPMAALVDSKCQ